MNWPLFTSTFALIFVAELPDKTAFATLLMATRGRPWAIFLGSCAAFFIQSLVSVAFGSLFSQLPQRAVHFSAGVLFLIYAILALRRKNDDSNEADFEANPCRRFWQNALSAFMVIFIAEWGDLTQLATASLAARYHEPITIFSAATLALWVVTAIAIIIGHRLKSALSPIILQRVAAAAFLAVGIYFLCN